MKGTSHSQHIPDNLKSGRLQHGGRKREGERSQRLQRHRDRRRGRYLSGGHLPLTTKWTLYSFNFRAVLWARSKSRMRRIQRHIVSSSISIATLLQNDSFLIEFLMHGLPLAHQHSNVTGCSDISYKFFPYFQPSEMVYPQVTDLLLKWKIFNFIWVIREEKKT